MPLSCRRCCGLLPRSRRRPVRGPAAGALRRGGAAPALAGAVRWAGAAVRLHNLYGPTETTVDATYLACQLDRAGRAWCRSGGRCANTRVFVLDGWLAAGAGRGGRGAVRGRGGAGAGVPGAAGADRGAVRGVPVRGGGERMYRTGDLARWTPGRGAGVRRAVPMTRSRSAGSGSSRARSRRCWPAARGWRQAVVVAPGGRPGRQRLVGVRGPGRRRGAAVDAGAALRAVRGARGCRTTWCRRRWWCWTRCR